ncbi:MAG: hypothetical protein LBQ15_10905 [Clostridium sp.]|nr:hypothetical protein [Clostridium sp.]
MERAGRKKPGVEAGSEETGGKEPDGKRPGGEAQESKIAERNGTWQK